jgi:hypothetical protein
LRLLLIPTVHTVRIVDVTNADRLLLPTHGSQQQLMPTDHTVRIAVMIADRLL